MTALDTITVYEALRYTVLGMVFGMLIALAIDYLNKGDE
jgi:hypothetical protein